MIYAVTPVPKNPSGGVQAMYRLVDTLNRGGFPATIVHVEQGYRADWFPNSTPIAYWKMKQPVQYSPSRDILLLPESSSKWIAAFPKIRKVFFNQNVYYTFSEYDLDFSIEPFYLAPEVIGVICVSENSRQYLSWTYPRLNVQRIRLGIDPAIFRPLQKKPQIAFILRRQSPQATQVINMLRHRGLLEGLELAPIDNLPQAQVATILGESAFFFSFAQMEGFSLPPAEAMACQCVAVGYHGFGGREYFLPEFSFPVEPYNVLEFVKSAQRAIGLYRTDRGAFDAMGRAASEYVRTHYSVENEQADIIAAWKALLAEGS